MTEFLNLRDFPGNGAGEQKLFSCTVAKFGNTNREPRHSLAMATEAQPAGATGPDGQLGFAKRNREFLAEAIRADCWGGIFGFDRAAMSCLLDPAG